MRKKSYRIDEIPYARIYTVSPIGNRMLFALAIKFSEHRKYSVLRYVLGRKGIISSDDEGIRKHLHYPMKYIFTAIRPIKHYIILLKLSIRPLKNDHISVRLKQRAHTHPLGDRGVDTGREKLRLYRAINKSVLIHLKVHRPKQS